jgi:putative addiction module component (TIGR02574 family)
MRAADISEINRLTTPEKILLVEELWDSIAAEATAVPVPASHMVEIDRRLKRHAAQPEKLLSLEELQARIENRK